MNPRLLSILVVDDEREIRELLTDLLAGAGHEVRCASDAADAEAITRDAPRPVDLAFVDYVLPGTNGMALIRRLREIRPGLPAVLLTGDARISTSAVTGTCGPVDLVIKPFDLAAIEDLVARIQGHCAHAKAP